VNVSRGVNQFFARRIPAVTTEIEGLYENKKALTGVVSARRSGGRLVAKLDIKLYYSVQYLFQSTSINTK
jgi:hypothetical protein